MNTALALRNCLTLFSSHPLLERLFFASVEFALLAAMVFAAIRVSRLRSPRLASLLWLLVLAKPIVSLAIGSPLPVVRMEVPSTAVATPAPPQSPPRALRFEARASIRPNRSLLSCQISLMPLSEAWPLRPTMM